MRSRLLATALELVETEGVPALTLRAIARAAGVSHGAPLRHFPSRAALLSAVAAEGYRISGARRAMALAGAGENAQARLRAAAEAYVRFAIDHPGLFGLMSRPDLLLPSDPVLSQASRPFFEQGVELVAARQATQGWRAGADSRLLAAALWAAAHGFAQLWLLGAITRVSHSGSLEAALSTALTAYDL